MYRPACVVSHQCRAQCRWRTGDAPCHSPIGVEECNTWTKVGIQSVYYGGGECNKSEVDWIENPNASGISDIAADAKAGKYVIYNIAGQRMNASRKGLNIINGRKVMVK